MSRAEETTASEHNPLRVCDVDCSKNRNHPDNNNNNTTTSSSTTAWLRSDSDSEDAPTLSSSCPKTTTSSFSSSSFRSSSGLGAVVELLLPWLGALVWPCMWMLPLALSTTASPLHYTLLFPESWYTYNPQNGTSTTTTDVSSSSPKPLGLILGILAVAVGQFWVCVFFYLFKFGYLSANGREPTSIQTKGARRYTFGEGLRTHLAQPEGFIMLVGYLTTTWMYRLLPNSYYSFQGGIQWKETFLCLVIQDGMQYLMHYLEHIISPQFYQFSHKPHHRFTNPRLFDAFNGSLPDTVCMITIPLISTAHIMRTCNVWTYMAFGSTYACWLTLIHSEYMFPWDPLFRRLGFGTPADHHVHHKVFKYNYGHLFMWYDQLGGTYKDPKSLAPLLFRPEA